MTRIYYTDPACLTFDSLVKRVLTHDGHDAAVLERTAFYPTSGGQPHDVGTLGGIAVVDVIDESGEVIHVLDAPLEQGTRVTGAIDARRRIDHMQQHTGQHVLSAAFDRLFDNRTTSFHMGSEVSTIDLAKEVGPAALSRVVAEANRIVWEDRPVSIRFVSDEEAARLPLRKEPAREGRLRLIEVDGFDLSACGGTHVARTGEIGIIGVIGTERFRGGTRVTFVCGGRALTALETYRDAITGSVRILSVLPHELPAAVERVHNEARDLRKQVGRLQEQLAGFEAARLVEAAEILDGTRLIITVIDGWDTAGIKSLAAAASRTNGVFAVIVSSSSPVSVAIARGADVTLDASQLLKALIAQFGGRGGGKPQMAQGGGLEGVPQSVVTVARESVASMMESRKP